MAPDQFVAFCDVDLFDHRNWLRGCLRAAEKLFQELSCILQCRAKVWHIIRLNLRSVGVSEESDSFMPICSC